MAFYEQALEAMAPRMEAALAGRASFGERIAAIMAVKFESFQPNRSFLGALSRHVANPQTSVAYQRGDPAHPRIRDQMYFARAIATKIGWSSGTEEPRAVPAEDTLGSTRWD